MKKLYALDHIGYYCPTVQKASKLKQESFISNMLVSQSLTSECFGNSTGYHAHAAVKRKFKEKVC